MNLDVYLTFVRNIRQQRYNRYVWHLFLAKEDDRCYNFRKV